MKIKVSIEELIDNDALIKYCEKYGGEPKELRKEKDAEVYINETEAEQWGFMARSIDMLGGG